MFRMPSIFHNRFWHAVLDSSEEDGTPRRFSNEAGLESMCAAHSMKILRMDIVGGVSELTSEKNMDKLAHSHILTRYTQSTHGYDL